MNVQDGTGNPRKAFLSPRSLFIVLVGVLAALGVFYADLLTTERFSFFIFYFPSIALASWHGNRIWGILFALFCGFLWMIAWAGVPETGGRGVYIWNGFVRFFTFLLISEVSFRIRSQQESLAAARAELKRLLDREKEKSRHDILTGALNSRGFISHLNEERRRSKRYGRPFSILYLDLDEFKEMNDSRGHAYGDDILRHLAGQVEQVLRDTDRFARLGGDEFAVLLPETGDEGALLCAARIREALRSRCEPPLRASIGCVSFEPPSMPATGEECIRLADQAMYRAKQAGKDRVEKA